MPRTYQKTTNNVYALPHDIYMRMVYMIKGYDRLKQEYQNILDSSPPTIKETQVASKNKSQINPTEQKAIKLTKMSDEINAIEKALHSIPVMYRRGAFDHIASGEPYPLEIASKDIWDGYKAKMIYTLAEILEMV